MQPLRIVGVALFAAAVILGTGGVCRGAIPIACGDQNVAGSTTLPDALNTYSCAPDLDTTGNEQVYEFTLTTVNTVHIALTGPVNLNLFLLDGASPTPARCLAWSQNAFGPGKIILFLAAAPGTYAVAVDGPVTIPQAFTISLTCTPINATGLNCGDTDVPGTPNPTGVIDQYPCASGRCVSGGETFFTIDLAQKTNLYLSLTMDLPGTDMDIILLPQGIDPLAPRCLAWGDTDVFVPAAGPGRYLVSLDGCAGSTGPFRISAFCGVKLQCGPADGDLQCGSRITGNTRGHANRVEHYSCSTRSFQGPELVYRLTNPVEQQVDIALSNAAPGMSVFLFKDCDEGACVDSAGDAVIQPRLAPGDYFVVVDGQDGAEGSFDLAVLCGAARLEPDTLDLTLRPGECVDEVKTVIFPTHVGLADVMFSIDCTGSMGGEIEQVRRNIQDIADRLSFLVSDLEFGLATFNEYPQPINDTVCPAEPSAPGPGATPFTLNLPLTNNLAAMQAALNNVQVLGGGIESYTRTLFEAYSNRGIGWRTCARKLWMNFGDELPQDCNVAECIGGNLNKGRDPGRDMRTGTADDLLLLPVIDSMAAADISLLHVDSSETDSEREIWRCLAERTGGSVLETYSDGTIPGGVDFAEAVAKQVRAAVRQCDNLTLTASPGYEAWLVSVTPPSYNGVTTPFVVEFTIRICAPAGTVNGDYTFQVQANCTASCLVSPDMFQTVHVKVLDKCVVNMAAPPSPTVCAGETVTLDGSSARIEQCTGVTEYRWLEGATVLRGWSTDPALAATPAASTVYTLEVRCSTETSCAGSIGVPVDVTAIPAAEAGADVMLCQGSGTTLDGSGSTVSACAGVAEYRWRQGATVIRDWSPDPAASVVPAGSAAYTLDVRCSTAPACPASDGVTIEVAEYPAAAAGQDRAYCKETFLDLDGSGSLTPGCASAPEYQWMLGPTVRQVWSPSPIFRLEPPEEGVFTLEVRCPDHGACASSDDVRVALDCPAAVRFLGYEARVSAGVVVVSWTTTWELDTLGFVVEAAADEEGFGPVRNVAFVPARGSGASYEALDPPAPPDAAAMYYRIVELTAQGRGDSTPFFAAAGRGGSRSLNRARR